MAKGKRIARKDYSEEEIERALQAVALYAGNANRAARELKKLGYPIPVATLYQWKKRFPDRYAKAREAIRDRVWAETSEEWKALVRQSIDATGDAVDRSKQATGEGNHVKAKAFASTAQSLATVSGIGDDKATRSDGRPTAIYQDDRSVPELLRTIRQKFGDVVQVNPELIESTAVEEDEQPLPVDPETARQR